MNILWVVNILLPYPSKKLYNNDTIFGGWINSLLSTIKTNDSIEKIAIATTYNGNKLMKYVDEDVIYYVLPCKNKEKYSSKLGKFWNEVIIDFKPDLIHIHGTEFAHSLSLLNINSNIPVVVSIQGLVSVYGLKKIYNADMSIKNIIFNITIKDLLKFDNIIKQSRIFRKRGKYEKEIIKKSNIIVGRTNWDYANTYAICMKDKYKICNESLREEFYKFKWDFDQMEAYTIFISQASYPIKGFHKVIDAVNILKVKYPNIKVYVGGHDIIKSNSKIPNTLKLNTYGNFIKKKIQKYHLEDSIIFLGLLNERQMCEQLITKNVFVQPSSIENSSNALGEAMILGVPCVASYVGGTADLFRDKVDGFLYPFDDSTMLAHYIEQLFSDKELCLKFSNNAAIHANETHSREKNSKTMVNIYKEMVK